ncbi:MAG: hypothetical protein AB7F19_07575 [Candidatus Babeliales bacterium]
MDPNQELPASDRSKHLQTIHDLLDEGEDVLTSWEESFLNSIGNWLTRSDANTLSEKQLAVLKDLVNKVSERLGYE